MSAFAPSSDFDRHQMPPLVSVIWPVTRTGRLGGEVEANHTISGQLSIRSKSPSAGVSVLSVQGSDEQILVPDWDILESTALRSFLNGKQPLVRATEHWHPREEDSVAQVVEAMELPLHVADQIYAQMLDSMKISEPLDEHSPWRAFNDRE